ncbi:MAG TPA: hypothetical protein VIM73_12475 [Polyangiaceae bacterium]
MQADPLSRPGAAPPLRAPAWVREIPSWPPLTPEPLPSQHFVEPHVYELRINPEARAAYTELTSATRFEPGTRIVMSLRHARTGQRGLSLAMEREREGWCFWVFDRAGVVRGSGSLEPCVGCHAGAPAAPLFGLPMR